jgi:hypothetical protein
MPGLITKLQYKNFEKGEFTDEKSRSCEQVIELLKDFPDSKTEDAENDPNDPSIVVLDANSNYLKIDIYPGNSFCLYYLGLGNEYYVHDIISLEKAAKGINEFFAGRIDLTEFEQQSYHANIRSYFTTNPFEYHLKFFKVLGLSIMWVIYLVLGIVAVIYIGLTNRPSTVLPPLFFAAVFTLLFGCVVAHIFINYATRKKQYLKISRGHNLFLFGNSAEGIITYKKSDVIEVKHYTDNSTRSPNSFHRYEIVFKDNSSITFSNALISPGDFATKWRLTIIEATRAPIKLTWSAP